MLRNIFFWLAIGGLLMYAFSHFDGFRRDVSEEVISYSEFIEDVREGKVKSVEIQTQKNEINGIFADGGIFKTVNPGDPYLVDDLLSRQVEIIGKPQEERSFILEAFISWLPMLLLIGVWIFFMRQMQGGLGGRGGAMSFGKSRAKLRGSDKTMLTFKDVAGVEEAKEEVHELVEFLREPARFQKLGGKIPKGILMIGSPGTGKTLLAKAIAGEAGVEFFTISGSDFVEMFVGVGASRVRDMFAQARKHAPCIVFIDEIDAVGRHRGAGFGGGHDEREQTLNQLLVEMDGFDGHEGIIVIAATNRPDVLDPALLRPGRFDRQVVVPLPDIRGREAILNIYVKKNIPLNDDVSTAILARGTPGLSGADLANLVNEASLLAAKRNGSEVCMRDFEAAKDKILMGSERKSMVMSEEERKLTAYHESGHAIVGRISPDHDPVYKVSIIPRGRALGVTMFLPVGDSYSHSKRKLNSQIASLFGGRIAEEIIFGEDSVTTGASNDIERATELARNMVTKWGLSSKLGPLCYSEEDEHPFLGQRMSKKQKVVSEETARLVDSEIKDVIQKNYAKCRSILEENIAKLHSMAEALLEYETIDSSQIDEIMKGIKPSPPSGWEASKDGKKKKEASKSERTHSSDGIGDFA